ncbi:MAG TPA: universal stress protein [Acidobacteriaceae bacterium]
MAGSLLRFRKIVVATELGDTGSTAVRYAQALAHRYDATLIILHVIDPMLYAFPDGLPQPLEKIDSARLELARMEEEARRDGIQTHSRVESGVICDRILQCVSDHRGDLLVLGACSSSATEHLALGTVVRRLIGRCPCPILTVPAEANPELFAARGWRNVLAATDFSPCGLQALETAHNLATGQYTVLHVFKEEAEDAENQIQTRIERLRFQAPFNESHTVPVDHIAAVGNAVEFVSGCARDLHADLLVLGAPPDQLPMQELPSSTILQIIAQAACPVLCIPVCAEGPAQEEHLRTMLV